MGEGHFGLREPGEQSNGVQVGDALCADRSFSEGNTEGLVERESVE